MTELEQAVVVVPAHNEVEHLPRNPSALVAAYWAADHRGDLRQLARRSRKVAET